MRLSRIGYYNLCPTGKARKNWWHRFVKYGSKWKKDLPKIDSLLNQNNKKS
jgi:hypothetical protein